MAKEYRWNIIKIYPEHLSVPCDIKRNSKTIGLYDSCGITGVLTMGICSQDLGCTGVWETSFLNSNHERYKLEISPWYENHIVQIWVQSLVIARGKGGGVTNLGGWAHWGGICRECPLQNCLNKMQIYILVSSSSDLDRYLLDFVNVKIHENLEAKLNPTGCYRTVLILTCCAYNISI